jgi:hypothetical protein
MGSALCLSFVTLAKRRTERSVSTSCLTRISTMSRHVAQAKIKMAPITRRALRVEHRGLIAL